MTGTVEELRRRVAAFRDEREWKAFHNLKDLAISVSIEAAELLLHCQWKTPEEVEEALKDEGERRAVADEMADIFILLLSAADVLDLDLYRAVLSKLEKNAAKYPVEKARGNARKYDRL